MCCQNLRTRQKPFLRPCNFGDPPSCRSVLKSCGFSWQCWNFWSGPRKCPGRMAREIEPPTLGEIPFLSEPFFAWWLSPWPSSQAPQLKSALAWQNWFVRTSTLECGGPHRTDEAVLHDMARKPTPLRPVHHAAGWRSGGTRALAHLFMTYL